MSKQINRSIIIDAKVKTTLEGMNEVVSKLNQGLRDGTTKIDLTKGIGSSLSKQMDKFKDEYSKFSKYIEGDKIEFADSKDAIKSGETLIKTFKELRRIIGDFDDLTVVDAKKLFPDAFDSKVSDLLKGLNGLSTAMAKLEAKQLDLSTAQTEMGELTREAERFQNLINQEATLKLELEKARSDLEHFDSEIEAIRAKAAKGITLKIDTAAAAQNEAKKSIEEIETARSSRGFNQEDFSGTTARAVKFKGKTEKQWKDESTKNDASEASKAEAAAALEAIRIYRQEENALKDLNAVLQARKKEVDSLRESLSNINNMKVSQAVEIAGGTTEEINEANEAMRVHAEATKEAAAARGRYNTAVQQAKGASDKIEKTNAALEAQQAKIDKITLEIGELNKEVSTEALEKAFSTAGVEGFNASMLKSKDGIDELKNKLNQLDEERLTGLKKALSDIGLGADKAEDYVEQLRGTLGGVKESADDIKKSASEMENLKNQVLQFFSLTNSVQLFKRAVTQALNTVKELDATMTEAAVVTEFDVGDMWDKLPQYSVEAQKLGVSINGMYQATTLYYQQGLKNNEAMALGVETMKMAKIAGLETADATKAMTAALRGFNMELNETSATRVNDVYSQLAAVTAADVSQISTAMEKTASIAASANMEFETTAALLAQIIETTQEAPETAGTAMKTIIARFSEVKSLKSQGLTAGKDSEGEDIDVNKIQTALRTVGISMDGFFAGTEGLDSVLLKLAEKWGSLDFETQRYIATMAAGSRQQSRFIAMMSDYGRTTELVGEAQNSAGASQRQYEKTLDSMESKLQKLENAWNQFLMGLSNNEILKGAVDTLTFIIDGVNKLIDALSGGNGLIKSIMSLVTVVGALKLGKTLLGGALNTGLGKIGQGLGLKPQGDQNTDSSKSPSPIPNPQASGGQAGTSWGAGFLAAVIKKLDGGRHTVEKKAEDLAGEPEGKVAGQKRASTRKQKGLLKKAEKSNQKKLGKITDRKEFAKELTKRNFNAEDNKKLKASVVKNEVMTVFDTEGAEAAVKKYKDLGGELTTLEERTEIANTQSKSLGEALSGAGQAAIIAGAGINLLGGLFESLGMEEAAEGCQWVGTALMGVGSALTMLPGLITGVASVATAAGISVQAAWWWLLIIMAVIISIVALVYILCKAFEAASEAAQLEKMNEQLEDLATAADEAKKKLEDMASAKEELAEMSSVFDSLVRGSREWKQALIENNQKVLELLNTYPQLAKYVEKGVHGELTITEEGWDNAMSQQQIAYTNALGAKTGMQSQVAQKEQYIDTENKMAETVGKSGLKNYADFADTGWGKAALIGGGLLVGAGTGAGIGAAIGTAIAPGIGTAIGAGIGTIAGVIAGVVAAPDPESVERDQTGGLTYDELNKFAALAAERGYSTADGSLDTSAAQEMLDELGLSVDNIDTFMGQLDKMGLAFDELANSAFAQAEIERARVDSIAASVAQTSNLVTASENFGSVAEEIGAQAFDDYSDRVADQASKYQEQIGNKDKQLDDEEAQKALQRYADMNGLTKEQVIKQIKDGDLSRETVANTLAAEDIGEEMKKAMEGTVKVLEKIAAGKSVKEVNQLKSLMTDRGEGLNIGAKTAIEQAGGVRQYLEQQGFTAEDAKAMGYTKTDENGNVVGDFDAYVKAMESNFQTGTIAFEKASTRLEQAGLSLESLPDDLTAGAAQGLASKLALVAANQGADVAENLMNSYDQLISGLSSEQAQMVSQYMAELDWSNLDAIEEFQSTLMQMGLDIPTDQLVSFVEVLKQTGNAVRTISFGEAAEKIKNLQSVIADISDPDQTRSFSQEQYEAIIAGDSAQAKNFIQDIDGSWVYVGNSIEDLIAALQENTRALLGDAETSYTAKAAVSGLLDKSYSNDRIATRSYFSGVQKYGTIDEAKELLNNPAQVKNLYQGMGDFVSQAIADGVDLSLLGIEGLSNNLDVAALTPEELLKIAFQVGNIDKKRAFNEQQAEEERLEAETWEKRNTNPHELVGASNQFTETQQQQFTREYLESFAEALNMSLDDYDIYSQDPEIAQQAMTNLLRDMMIEAKAQGNGAVVAGLNQGGYVSQNLSGERIVGTKNTIEQSDINALKLQAAQYGVSEALLTKFNKALATNDEEQIRAAGSALSNAIAEKKAEQQYGKTLKKLGEVNDEYETVQEGMQGYTEGVVAYGEALNLDMTDENNFAFVADNLDLIRQAAEGDIASILELQQLLAAEHGLVITADGNFDLYNSEVDLSNEKTQDFINSQLAAGAYEIVEIEAESNVEYLVPDGNGGFKIETYEQGSIIQTVRPQDAASIARAEEYSGTGSGSGGGGSSEEWENPYDELYNTLRQINEELRKREKLERRYQALLEKTNVSARELAQNKETQITNLEGQRYLQQQVVQGRKDQIQETLNENSSLNKYASVEYDEQGNPILRINYDEIAKVTDPDKGAEIEEYIGELEELVDGLDEANDELEVIDDDIKEIRDRGREGFVDLETRLMDALVNSYQEEIDALTETSEAIDEANSQLIDGIQTVLDAERQERDNEKTEEDIADKQARLAYLQMDTSGANQVEILSLQEEIDEAQEDYTDTLIDQKISELQTQNEEASLQRERQIELAQSQLDYWVETGALWSEVHNLMNGMIGEDGTININSAGYQMLMQSEGFPSMSALAQSDWAQDISSLAAEVFSWIHKDNTVKALLDSKDLEAGESLTFTDASGDEITGTIQEDGTVKTADGKVFSGVYRDPMTMEYHTNEEADDIKVQTESDPPPPPEVPEITQQDKWGAALAIWNGNQGWGSGNTRVNRLKEVFGENNGVQSLVNKGANTVARNATGKASDYSYAKMKEKFKKYKTGGLADYTGLAWLDGTPSKPELVLNQQETQMFIALKDVLAGFMKNRSDSNKSANSGDNYFEIDINVEKLDSAYDIEQIAADVKDLIRRDAAARNVNLIGPKS